MTKRNWRRTSFRRLDGSIDIVPDDWCLEDDAGQPLARIFLYAFGPNAGRWAWFVQVAPDGTPYNGGTGTTATWTEAREECERRIHEGVRMGRSLPDA